MHRLVLIFAVAALVTVSGLVRAQNQPPAISIASVPTLSVPNTIASLQATVTDDGLSGSPVQLWWAKLEGPGPVIFEDRRAASTTALFNVAGEYVIHLTADDGQSRSTETVLVTLNDPPNLPIVVQNVLDATQANGFDSLFNDRFLTMVAGSDPPNVTGAQYYNMIDPLGTKSTFSAWRNANGFPANAPALVTTSAGSGGTCCTSAVYGNAADLGFGRRMVMSRNGGDVAFYVENYRNVDTTVTETPADFLLTVAMEYSALPGDDPDNRYVKFFVFDEQGNRVTGIDFDGRGAKDVPAACVVCHGGSFLPNGSLSADGRIGAYYLPFDTENLDFPVHPELSLAEQEASFREFNAAIMDTDVPMAVRELIEGWYGGFGLPSSTQNQQYVPSGWANEPELYRKVVAPSCRSCHVAQVNSQLDFDSSQDFASRAEDISGPLVFGPGPSGFRMPHALTTFRRFWLSTSPHQPDVLASAFDANGDFVGLGAPAGRMFVNQAAVGAADGSSWEDAFTDLENALSAAAAPGSNISEIWVAAGTYLPSIAGLGDPRSATFNLPSGLAIYGGFAGGETLLEQRDILANTTLLSGDLDQDDDFLFSAITDNAYHVVTASGTSSTTRLDGVMIAGGNAEGAPDARGGGVLLTNGGLNLTNVIFHLNAATEGGACFVEAGSLRCVACNFSENISEFFGAGISLDENSSLDATSTLWSHNVVTNPNGLGGAIYAFGSTVKLFNVTLHRNYADEAGGGIYALAGADLRLVNSILWHNCSIEIDEEGQIAFDNSMGTVVFNIDHNIIQRTVGSFGGTGNIDSDPLFIDEVGPDGIFGSLDEIFELAEGSPAIDVADANAVPVDLFDLDHDGNMGEATSLDLAGKPRLFNDLLSPNAFAGRPPFDLGAFEYDRPALPSVGSGNVGIGFGGPFDVLMINGSAGGAARRVDVGLSQPIGIDMTQPPSNPDPAPFALFGRIGAPIPSEAFFFPFGIGAMAFAPEFLAPFEGSLGFTLADNIGLGQPPLLPSTPTPWSTTVGGGLDVVSDIALQGIVFDPTSPFFVRVTNGVIVSLRENFLGNQAPEAVVVEDSLRVCAGQMVTLDGSDSFDPDGDMIDYQWTQTSGTPVVLTGADTAIATFTAAAVGETPTFELVVDDGIALSAAAVVTVEIPATGAPVASAGPDQGVITGASVTLDGSDSCDPDGGALSFQWNQVSGTAVVFNNAIAGPTFTAPAVSGELVFELVVTDAEMLSSVADSVTINVLTSFTNDVYPIFSTMLSTCGGGTLMCIDCHTPGGIGVTIGNLNLDQAASDVRDALLLGRVDLDDPPQSLVLRKPLALAAGGVSHTGGEIFCDETDPNYQTILRWIQEGALDN